MPIKPLFISAAIALSAAAAPLTAAAQPDVGVSVQIGQPGFYGRIDIGNAPRPQLIYPQPIVIQQPAYRVERAPIYLRVPPGHAKKWSKHCSRYNACGQPVYFVQDGWYRDVYGPHWREQRHGPGFDDRRERDRGRSKHKNKHKNKGHGKHDD